MGSCTLGNTPPVRGLPQVSRLLSCDPHTGTFLKLSEAQKLILQNADKDGVSGHAIPKSEVRTRAYF